MTPRRQDSDMPSWLYGERDDDEHLAHELVQIESVPPLPPNLCRLPSSIERSFDPRFVRNILRPIGQTLCGLFGFQQAQPLSDADSAEGAWIRSSLDNQVDHLTSLLKWRMDRIPTPNTMQALELAVGELHGKMFANYNRWVRHVNLQRVSYAGGANDDARLRSCTGSVWTPSAPSGGNVRASMAGFGADEGETLALAALSGDAWDFCGLWGFKSGDEERKWVANAQMHQLMLWYLIWGEAGNLRHMPECLCLLLYSMSNALQLSGGNAWEVASLFDEAKGPYGISQSERMAKGLDSSTRSSAASQVKGSDGGGPEDFLHSIVTPIYQFLEHEVLKRKDDPVAARVMYDDVNETFWSTDAVHGLLGHGFAHEPTAYRSRIDDMPRQAYNNLRRRLVEAKKAGAPAALRRHFRKTYCEIPGWFSVYQAFYRVYVLHACLLHLTFSVAFFGWSWSAMCTWTITHASLKAVRQFIFSYTVWDLKRPPKLTTDEMKKQEQQRSGLSGRKGLWYAAPRSFKAFVRNSTLRILFFLLVPVAYVIELSANRAWVERTCVSSPDDWCAANVRSTDGVARTYLETCIGSDGTNYLVEYCLRCSPSAPTSAVVSGGLPLAGSANADTTQVCALLDTFATNCLSQCGTYRSQNWVFQSIATLYTVVFVGSYLFFLRPGAMGEFQWGQDEAGSIGLGRQYIATPQLLRVPMCTALLYYLVWGACLAVKVTFGYYALVAPLVGPVNLLWSTVTFNCWYPWTDATKTNDYCDYVPGGESAQWSLARNVILRLLAATFRVAVPCMMYFLDTYLWFSWTTGICSTLLGLRMGLGKVRNWGELVTTFAESCHLFNDRLLANITPSSEPLTREGLSLLRPADLAPTAIRAAARRNERRTLTAARAPFLHEARAAPWQRWARAWNEVVHSLRQRDHLSNSERDELLFFSLVAPEHQSFFGVSEYLVLPAMVCAPVFYPRIWHRGLSHLYDHTSRVVLQVRDLACWLLVHLGVTPPTAAAELLDVTTTLIDHAGAIMRKHRGSLVQLLKEVRRTAMEALTSLFQWRKELLHPPNRGGANPESEGAHTGGGDGGGASSASLGRVATPQSEDEGGGDDDAAELSAACLTRFEERLSAMLDAFKSLLAAGTGEVEVSMAGVDDAVLSTYTRLRSLISLRARRAALSAGKRMGTALSSPACGDVLRALQRSLTSDNPGGEPRTAEARRQLLFFCNSLRNRWMPAPATVRRMRTISSFTPHYAEDVTYSEAQLKNLEHRDDGVNLESLLRSLFAQEWANLCERVRPESESAVPITELAAWASDRAQVLSRTVRGVMLYADALRIQARLEGVHDDEVEAVVASKFEYVVTCQIYAKLRDSKKADDQWKAKCIDELRHKYAANLRIAYVETVKAPTKSASDIHYSVLLGVDPQTHVEQVRYKVKLPGNPIIGEGKPENQNHAVIFTRGEYLQTLDMNQDNYLGEAYKLRNLLECFSHNVRIVGCREHIFSEAGGAVAAFAASNEFVFGTSLQRFLTYPLCVRFHYGHPDSWDKQWAITNGGVSKASRTLHLSEDIFAGFNCVMRGGAVVYQEFIHVGKGRDMGFIAINGFEQKISAGNALQCTSRELYRMGKNFDLPRLLSFYFTGTGFFVTQRLTTAAIYVLTVAYLIFALLRAETITASNAAVTSTLSPAADSPAGPLQRRRALAGYATDVTASFYFNATSGYAGELVSEFEAIQATWTGPLNTTTVPVDVGSFTVNTYEANFGLLQLGFFSVLPFFLELWLEHSLSDAIWENAKLIGMLSWVFFLFASQTKGFRLAEAIRYGKAGYVATGRGYVIEPGSFIGLYAVFAKSHIYTGVEALCLIIFYHIFADAPSWASVWTLWFFAFSMMLAPYLFNPQSLSTTTIYTSFEELRAWFRAEADPASKDHHGSWRAWHENRLKAVRGAPMADKLRDHTRILLIRAALLWPTAARLEMAGNSLPVHRMPLLLLAAALMCACQVAIWLLAARRTFCGRCLDGLDGVSRWLGGLYRLVVLAACVVGGGFVLHLVVSPYVDFTWSVGGRLNAVLFFFAALLVNTFLLQAIATLEPPPKSAFERIPPPPPEDRQAGAVASNDAGGGGFPLGAYIKAGLISYADYWYFVMDGAITLMLIGILFALSMLPVLRLQSVVLFNRDFASVISTKLNRAELLKRIVL